MFFDVKQTVKLSFIGSAVFGSTISVCFGQACDALEPAMRISRAPAACQSCGGSRKPFGTDFLGTLDRMGDQFERGFNSATRETPRVCDSASCDTLVASPSSDAFQSHRFQSPHASNAVPKPSLPLPGSELSMPDPKSLEIVPMPKNSVPVPPARSNSPELIPVLPDSKQNPFMDDVRAPVKNRYRNTSVIESEVAYSHAYDPKAYIQEQRKMGALMTEHRNLVKAVGIQKQKSKSIETRSTIAKTPPKLNPVPKEGRYTETPIAKNDKRSSIQSNDPVLRSISDIEVESFAQDSSRVETASSQGEADAVVTAGGFKPIHILPVPRSRR